MGRDDRPLHEPASPRVRLVVALAAGVLVGTVLGVLSSEALAALVGWDVTVLVYVGWTWASEWRLDAQATARLAEREDPGRAVMDALLLVASVASLIAVGTVIVRAGSRAAVTEELDIGLAVASVVASWTMVHTVFTARYARLYYTGPDGGIDFNEDDRPQYMDFAYMAFTIGMTYQVSDTDITAKEVRGTALRHALLSYLLGSVTFALAINLVVNLAQ